ncbi:MAG: dihydrolipoamide acetyltransferase family protein [Deltaproteobacteria bacterium]
MATEIVLPMLGITVERGKIIEWKKKEGDPVEKGEIIFVVEVEKATTEVESPASGIMAKILVPEGLEVPVLTVVGVITEAGEELPAKYLEPVSVAQETRPQAEAVSTAVSKPEAARLSTSRGEITAVPAARHLVKERGMALEDITGTGPEGMILVKDVEAVLAGARNAPETRASTLAHRLAEKESVPLAEVDGTGVRGRIMRSDVKAYLDRAEAASLGFGTTIPMSTVRKVIARRMSESAFTAPHIYFFNELPLDPLLSFREEVVRDFETQFGIRPSINDFLIKAVALTILQFPMLNARIEGEAIRIMPEINVGLAVAVEEGLIVPAVSQADRCGLVEIAKQRQDLVQRAREGKLTLPEMERGTFTVSSLAQYDITHFTAILNPPQSGILSVGKTDEKLFMEEGQVVVKKVVRLGLSVDHRIVDGAVAADFLQNLKWKLERPSYTFLNL